MAAALVGGAVLSSVLNVAFDRLSSPEVVNWIKGKKLDKKLATLKTTLYAAQAFLNDAEKKQIRDTAVKDWLSDLKDAVYKADDLLDEISTRVATQKDRPGNFLSRYLNLQDKEMIAKIEDIIDTLESILKHKDALGLREIPKEDMSWRITSSLVESSDIYGRDKDKEAIIKLLLDDTSESKISVIPIVGQGGIGKTTLAQVVYHDDKVKQYYDFQSWICISEEFDVVKVTKTIIQAITRLPCDTNDLNLLQHDLKEMLSRKKFLIVLDDAWNENYDDWIRLLKPFRNGVKGSKILLTTRSRKVASVVQTVPPHELRFLSHEDCWLVFAKHALLSTDSTLNPTLEKIGRQIVNKCNGLPLAAQTLGGLLRGKHDVGYWNHILKSEIWEFSEDSSKIIPALRISYYYLPPCLKECFVYCSLYPQDYQFDKDALILLWMAENFLQPMGKKSLKDVGDEYFDELVSRSFFQHYEGGLFVMHDLMHDLATSYAGEFYFRAEELGNAAKIGIKTRRLSHNAKSDYPILDLLAICDRVKHTRTFLEVNLNSEIPFNMENAPCILLSQLKCLRVLSFKCFPLDSLPDSISELIHLRYLDLSQTGIVALPESLCNLFNLQTLKLFNCCKLKLLPIGMQDLVNLRYLDTRCTPLAEMPKGMSKLKHLQFLSDYVVGKNEENKIRELGALVNLCGSLRISKLENVIDSGEALEAGMVDKKNINKLVLRWSPCSDTANSQDERDILDKLRPHQDLKELLTCGYRGTMFPDWLRNSSYHNMTTMSLAQCKNCCMLPSLGQLLSLKNLRISDFDRLEVLGADFYKNDGSWQETPFPSLEWLEFNNMPCWQEWCLPELDAFPQLKWLAIIKCPMLKRDLPSHLPALEEITIRNCGQLSCSLPMAPMIHDLRVQGDNKIKMQELPLSLHYLHVEGNHVVQSMLEPITHTQLTCLIALVISNCSLAISLPVACLPTSLQCLIIKHCRKLELQMQHQHESLESLQIIDSCDSHTSFRLDAFPNLASVKISGCENMESLVVAQSTPLHELTIKECPNLLSFSTVLWIAAPQLEHLEIKACPGINSFLEGGPLPNLRDLRISHCEKLVSFLGSMNSQSQSYPSCDLWRM